jgi:hypothetical protein
MRGIAALYTPLYSVEASEYKGLDPHYIHIYIYMNVMRIEAIAALYTPLYSVYMNVTRIEASGLIYGVLIYGFWPYIRRCLRIQHQEPRSS